ncbi:MAG: phenylalanine--tRNA ligase subunit beta [Spirochaetales bacterium]|nr:phenylalanine--tRNA ligase subunit beta [Spirochaetales bacterium]
MPKIEIVENLLNRFVGKGLEPDELESIAVVAKAEIDGRNEEEGLIKIELNDTNRPDLWSTPGLSRQFNIYLTGKKYRYDFFSTKKEQKQYGSRIIKVDPALKDIRPFIAAFVAEGPKVDEPLLIDLIQSQEKLCWNYGRKRSSIAMGIYRADIINFPVHFKAADPDKTKFIPLGEEHEMSLRTILKDHPKGMEFGWIVSGYSRYPYLADEEDKTLSFPPIINSAHLGAVKVGDSSLFIELTGTDMNSLLLTASIAACDLADAGFTIKPVKVEYPYETIYGKEIVTPYYFQKPITLNIDYSNKLLGENLSVDETAEYIKKMGNSIDIKGNNITLVPPPYRNDFMHPVDIIEEVMIGRGMNSFEPVFPEDFTPGRISYFENFARRVRDIMVGLGYQEMIYNYLGSRKDFIEKMNISGNDVIEIGNPMTENFEILRNSILPNLLNSEAVSGNALYPHKIFETGKIAVIDEKENYGTSTRNYLSLLLSDREAGFNEVNSHISAVFYYLSLDYSLKEAEDPRFISGRCADIMYNNKKIGIMGEINPEVLDRWGIEMPCAAAEIDIDFLIDTNR